MTTLAALARRAHARYANHPALFDGTRWLTFAELGAAARRTARRLFDRGLRPGDRVVLALDNAPEVLVVEHALFLSGLVRVALSSRLHEKEIAGIADDCDARLVLTDRTAAAELTAPGVPDDDLDVPEPAPDDVAALMYTSGTTGDPKGAIVTHRAWVAMVRAFWAELPPIGPGDVVVHAAPMSHFGGSAGSAITLRGGAAVTLPKFEPAKVLAAVEEHRVTVLPAVPTMLTMLTAEAESGRYDLGSLRAVPYGGSPISAPAAARADAVFGEVLYQCYGLSEALAPVTVLGAREHRHGGAALSSAGRPTAEVEVRVGDDGEVSVRGACVFPGYWRRPEETAAVLDDDGWFHTGDIGRFDDDGNLYLVDRIKDVIVSGGFNVYPSEVERAIAELRGVRDVVVFGVPDERWGEGVAAAVVRDPGASVSADDVVAACRDRLAGYKKPRHVEFVDALPVASTGKVARRALRDTYLASNGGSDRVC